MSDDHLFDDENQDYEATLENIRSIGMPLAYRFYLPVGWEAEVYEYLARSSQESLDGIGSPSEGDVLDAILGIGYTEFDQ
jgi:hypothetical protein